MPSSIPGKASPLPSTQSRAQSVDARTSGHGVQSARSRDNTPVSGDKGTGSPVAEPPSGIGHGDLNPVDLDPPMASNAASSPAPSSTPNKDNVLRLREVFDWSDSYDNDDLGDVPEYPVLKPTPSPTETSPKLSKAPLDKGKSVDPLEKGGPPKKELFKDWLGDWTTFDENMAELNRPAPDDSDESLVKIEEFADKCNKVDNLQERVHELERFVIQAQTREEMVQKLVNDTFRAPIPTNPESTHQTQAPDSPALTYKEDEIGEEVAPVKDSDPPSITRPRSSEVAKSDTRYWRASSLLPNKSSVKHAMMGSDLSNPDSSDSSSESDNDSEVSSTESSAEDTKNKATKGRNAPTPSLKDCP
ncbi:hypothetical protein DFJ58DRAFT_734568 [Suillus subalutaceus]|uniref:uncharacterized protein n=1 Tax=Suillus subalutaceus TaxID=48586 RepID=UPI001B870B3A|nr:uncharacterized protein DFJ58DRAFT_734568 [Suillus subalutaceus]KAG1837124.1 hypothetical protein DFJ58DRAFT_734568 [Suillus subalutaceus]